MALFRALRHPSFALLLFGQSLSRVGDFVFHLALAWWIATKINSPLVMSTVFIFEVVPTLILILLGGVVVDRFSRVRILLISDFGRGIVMIIITLLAANNQLEIWMIYVLSMLFSLADAFFQPAYIAIVPQLAPADDLPSANALSSLSLQLARVLGPVASGVLMGFGGVTFAFAINAASFIISGLLLFPLLRLPAAGATPPTTATPASTASAVPEPAPETFLQSVIGGWRVVIAQPILWASILLFTFSNILLSGPFSVALPFLVKDFMGGDEKMLGWLLAIFPIGYVLGSLVLGNLKQLRWRGLMLFGGTALAGLALGALGLGLPPWALVLVALINGAALEMGVQAWANILQSVVPPEKLGRVASIDTLGSYALLPLGYSLAGLMVAQVGPAATFAVFGGLCAVGSLLPLVWRPIRQFD